MSETSSYLRSYLLNTFQLLPGNVVAKQGMHVMIMSLFIGTRSYKDIMQLQLLFAPEFCHSLLIFYGTYYVFRMHMSVYLVLFLLLINEMFNIFFMFTHVKRIRSQRCLTKIPRVGERCHSWSTFNQTWSCP